MSEVPFGRWPSLLSEAVAAKGRSSRYGLASDDVALYWLESRPEQGGRVVLVRAERGKEPQEVSPPDANVRSRVHEYGGGAFCLHQPPTGSSAEADGFCFVDLADQRIWRHDFAGGVPVALSEVPDVDERLHHGDLRSVGAGRWLLAVRERHHDGEVTRQIIGVDTEGGRPISVIAQGADFFAAPQANGPGSHLAFLRWNHPNMPWDGTELWVGELVDNDGHLGLANAVQVAGGVNESIDVPTWRDDDTLVYVSDANGFSQPWQLRFGGTPGVLCDREMDFSEPAWSLGARALIPLDRGRIGCRWHLDGADHVGVLDHSGALSEITQPCVGIGALCQHQGELAWSGATAALVGTIYAANHEDASTEFVAEEAPMVSTANISVGEAFTFRGRTNQEIHGLFYPPTLEGTDGPTDDHPPLIVQCHGGPTSSVRAGFDVVTQYFTSRGFGFAAIDYGGSAGYGRAYRARLDGQWGIADADDCVDAARHLAAEGVVDGRRMAIRGSSSGGLTALNALIRSDQFAAGVTWYGVTDLLSLAAATHDFEACYMDRLIGPLPEAIEEYRRRSPVNRVGEITGAVLLLQGLDDPVVPPSQATAMADALRERGMRCELVTFAGESHGFRRAETIEACLRKELDFYLDVFGL